MHPVGILRLEGIDDLALAQRAYLIVDEAEHPIGVLRPVALRFLLGLQLAAGIAHENGLVSLPRGFQSEIVIDAAVGEDDLTGERLALESSRSWA